MVVRLIMHGLGIGIILTGRLTIWALVCSALASQDQDQELVRHTTTGDSKQVQLSGKKGPMGPYFTGDEVRPNEAPPLCRLLTNEPISIGAERLTFDTDSKEYTAETNVEMRQGDVTLTCEHLVIVCGDGTGARSAEGRGKTLGKGLENVTGIKRIAASGNVKIVFKERLTAARKIIYDCVKGTLVIEGVKDTHIIKE